MSALVSPPGMEPVTTPAPEKQKTAKAPRQSRETAETMATRQRDISVSEFFAKNRHLLGFDNPRKALLTTVKEAVDNSLDACEEGGILPEVTVVIEDLQPDRPATAKSSRYRVTVVDNGPGIVRKQVENVFGRLLYGSKFHRLKMSRGQQGIGISAAGMYGLLTTGKPMVIQTRPSARKPAHHIELAMNTKTNRAEVTVDEETEDFPIARLRETTPGVRSLAAKSEFLSPDAHPTGASVSIELEGKYQRGRGSVDEFLELTAIANPHARLVFVRPTRETAEETDEPALLAAKPGAAKADGAGEPSTLPLVAAPTETADLGDVVVYPRAVHELPPETREIQPHPRGVELGMLLQMLREAEAERGGWTLYQFLQDKFSRVSSATASALCEKIGRTSRTRIADVDHAEVERLYNEMQDAKLPPPPTDCLAPIGVRQLLAGMLKGVRAEFYAASSREADVYRGRPFLIEAAVAYGGDLPREETSRVIRFANRVPLLYQQSACSSFKAVAETNWRNYDLQQPRGGAPIGPLVVMIHMASVWVPFTSESKEAIADYDEIRKEMKLALMECGRKLGTYLRKRAKMRREGERRDVFARYIGEIAKAVSAITGEDAKPIYEALLIQARERTAVADQTLDDEGRVVKDEGGDDQDGVLIVDRGGPPVAPSAAADDFAAPLALERGASSKKRGARRAPSPDAPPIGKPTKAEAAALKVASMAKARGRDADEPPLLDVSGRRSKGTPERADSKAKRGRSPSRAAAPAPSRASSRTKTPAPPPAKAKPSGQRPPSGAAQPTKPGASAGAKPKYRYVNGAYVRIDPGVDPAPGLF